MDVPLSEFNALDLERELYARALDTDGSKEERYYRLLTARQEAAQAPWRTRRPAIAKFGARVQLEDFAETQTYKQAEWELLTSKLQWRLEHVRSTEDGEGLEYFNPAVLARVDAAKTYMLNMDEFLIRQEPYVHKVFVVFVSRTNGQEHHLCYARSLAKLRSWDENLEEFEWPFIASESLYSEGAVNMPTLQTTIITPENIAKALMYILTELNDKQLQNYVVIACDQNRLSLAVVNQLVEATGHVMVPCLFDISDLQKSFRSMFCSACVRCSMRVESELYAIGTYEEQLSRICNSNNTKNISAGLLLLDYVNRLPGILLSMWNFEEHRDKLISLIGLNNKMIKIYGCHLKRELPPITYEDCAAGAGLLQLIVFDALWCMSPERETEELNANATPASTTNPTGINIE